MTTHALDDDFQMQYNHPCSNLFGDNKDWKEGVQDLYEIKGKYCQAVKKGFSSQPQSVDKSYRTSMLATELDEKKERANTVVENGQVSKLKHQRD